MNEETKEEGTGTFSHYSVLKNEAIEALNIKENGIYVDCTAGGGGHSLEILKRLSPEGRLFCIDRDDAALKACAERLKDYEGRFCTVKSNFSDVGEVLKNEGIGRIDGALLDLGVSSYQLDTPERGFSYHEDAPLDMRMDTAAALTAGQVVNQYSQEALKGIIQDYGEERYAARIAGAIVKARQQKPIESTLELAQIVKNAIPAANRREGPHPARRTFQALRIAVNGELDGLDQAIVKAHDLLKPRGRMAVITFQSLEDRIVKNAFRQFEHPCTCDPRAPICTCGKRPTARILTKKPLIAGPEELEANPRARSAKLRGIEKL